MSDKLDKVSVSCSCGQEVTFNPPDGEEKYCRNCGEKVKKTSVGSLLSSFAPVIPALIFLFLGIKSLVEKRPYITGTPTRRISEFCIALLVSLFFLSYCDWFKSLFPDRSIFSLLFNEQESNAE